jgi:hypothetical protein
MSDSISQLRARLQEPSTRIGIVFLVGLLGHKISIEWTQNAIDAFLLILSLYEIWRKEHAHKENPP